MKNCDIFGSNKPCSIQSYFTSQTIRRNKAGPVSVEHGVTLFVCQADNGNKEDSGPKEVEDRIGVLIAEIRFPIEQKVHERRTVEYPDNWIDTM